MTPITKKLHDLGRDLWLDNISRELLTINPIPKETLRASADHGKIGATLPADGGYAEALLDMFRREGLGDEALIARLQRRGIEAFATSWGALMLRIDEKRSQLKEARFA